MSVLLVAVSLAAAPAQSSIRESNQVRREFGSTPLYFEPNEGQADSSVRFLSRTATGLTAILQDGSLMLSRRRDRVDVHLSGPTQKPTFTAEDKLEGVSHYYLGTRAIENTPHYARVRASQVRPGLDVVYYGNAQRLEYDLIFQPGSRPDALR